MLELAGSRCASWSPDRFSRTRRWWRCRREPAPVSTSCAERLRGRDRVLRRRDRDGPARLPIDRVFSVKGFGTVVTGTLVSRHDPPGRRAVVLPRRRRGQGTRAPGSWATRSAAEAGRRVAVNLGGVEVARLTRGDTLCTPGAFEPTRASRRRRRGARRCPARCAMVRGSGSTRARRSCSVAWRSPAPAQRATGRALAEIAPGGSAYARIRLEAPAVLTRGDRFILRAYSPSDHDRRRDRARSASAARRASAMRRRWPGFGGSTPPGAPAAAVTAPCSRSSRSAAPPGCRAPRWRVGGAVAAERRGDRRDARGGRSRPCASEPRSWRAAVLQDLSGRLLAALQRASRRAAAVGGDAA